MQPCCGAFNPYDSHPVCMIRCVYVPRHVVVNLEALRDLWEAQRPRVPKGASTHVGWLRRYTPRLRWSLAGDGCVQCRCISENDRARHTARLFTSALLQCLGWWENGFRWCGSSVRQPRKRVSVCCALFDGGSW
jgi:hypothetical protein